MVEAALHQDVLLRILCDTSRGTLQVGTICDLFCFIARACLAQNPSSKYLPGPHPALGYARTGANGSEPQLVTLQKLHAAGSRRGERALGKDHSQSVQKLAFCGPWCILPRHGRFEYPGTHKASMRATHQSCRGRFLDVHIP